MIIMLIIIERPSFHVLPAGLGPLLHREVEQHFKYLQVTFCDPELSSQRDVWHRCFVKHVLANS